MAGYCHLAPKRRRRHLSSKTRKILALLQRQRHRINRLFNGPWRETSWGAAHSRQRQQHDSMNLNIIRTQLREHTGFLLSNSLLYR